MDPLARADGDQETLRRVAPMNIKQTKKMMEEIKELLSFMGCPVVQAAGEAEVSHSSFPSACNDLLSGQTP